MKNILLIILAAFTLSVALPTQVEAGNSKKPTASATSKKGKKGKKKKGKKGGKKGKKGKKSAAQK